MPFQKILTWSKLTLSERYNFLLGGIIVVLISVVVSQDNQYRNYVEDCRLEKRLLQEKIDEQKEERIRFFQQMSDDYLLFLNELNKIKIKNDES